MRKVRKVRIGVHTSIAGGYSKALERAKKLGINTIQIFSSSPRNWNINLPSLDYKDFKNRAKELDIQPIYFHASYLINLADKGRTGALSKRVLINELNLASKLGIRGSVVHLGSFKKMKDSVSYARLLSNIEEILDNIPPDVVFIIENSAVNKIGRDLNEIYQIIKDLKDKRLKVCLDTCHLFAAGYPIHKKEELDNLLAKFDKEISLDRLELIHMNDSKDEFGSLRDRHENIGEGKLGLDTFRTIINHPLLKDLPFILETPGFAHSGLDLNNVDILKRLVLTKSSH